MKDLYDFASNSPYLTFFLVWIVLYSVTQVVTWPFRLANRWIRSRNIAARGWPPFHLDADGDTRDLDEDDIAALKASSVTRPLHSTPEKL